MNPQRKENITKFVTELLKKMDAGEKEHGESTGGEVEEIENELLDIVGWAFVRWERLQKLKPNNGGAATRGRYSAT